MLNLVILLLTYVFIIIFGFIRGLEHEKDYFSGVSMTLDISLFFITIITFFITTYLTTEDEASISLLTLVVTVIDFIVFIVSWKAKLIYNKLFLEEKKVKNKSIGKTLCKNYSRQHADLILKFYKLLISGNYAKRLGKIRYLLHIPYQLENRGFSYWDDDYDRINIITRLVDFVNINIEYSDSKEYSESIETILLEKENAKIIVFVLNVLEDNEKMKFLSTEEGEMQLKVLGNDLIILNRNIKEDIEKIVKLTKDTKANKMNEDFNLLRKNSFDKIEEMKK